MHFWASRYSISEAIWAFLCKRRFAQSNGSSEPLERMWTMKLKGRGIHKFYFNKYFFFFLKASWRENAFLPLKLYHRLYLFSIYNKQTSSQSAILPLKLLYNMWNEVKNVYKGSFWHFCLLMTPVNLLCLIRPFTKTRFIDHQPLDVLGDW